MKLSAAQIKFLKVIEATGERGNSSTWLALRDKGLFEKAPPTASGFSRYRLTEAGTKEISPRSEA